MRLGIEDERVIFPCGSSAKIVKDPDHHPIGWKLTITLKCLDLLSFKVNKIRTQEITK
jgi:hypothetical protein